MNTTLLFFLLLIPLSGFVAWAGDRIGHRVGKRRHTLLGLRPRHTAILFTVGAGIGIALISFALMFASSEGFRVVLARGTELLQINRDLARDNKRLEHDRRVAQQQILAMRAAAQDADRVRRSAESARDEARRRQKEAESLVLSARTRLLRATAALQSERTRLLGAQRSLSQALYQVSDARAQLATAERNRDSAQSEARRAEQQAVAARTDARSAREKVFVAERTFREVTRVQSQRLAIQREQLTAQARLLADETEKVVAQRTEVSRLTAEVARLETVRTEAVAEVARLRSDAAALRQGRITYRVGEELARLAVAPGKNIWRIQGILDGLLTAAAKNAEARGARMGTSTLRAAAIPERLVPDERGTAQSVNEFDAIRLAAQEIRRVNADVVVVVVATANAVNGEPVSVDLRTFRNPTILTAGAPLGETVIDGTRPRQEVADTLYSFLRREVRAKLSAAGAIPPLLGPDGDADQDLVTLSGEEWLRVMDEVRQVGGRARVVVRAARNLRAADPIALAFEVRPADQAAIAR
jgi:uncharacterized protein (DUF3084 family)